MANPNLRVERERLGRVEGGALQVDRALVGEVEEDVVRLVRVRGRSEVRVRVRVRVRFRFRVKISLTLTLTWGGWSRAARAARTRSRWGRPSGSAARRRRCPG